MLASLEQCSEPNLMAVAEHLCAPMAVCCGTNLFPAQQWAVPPGCLLPVGLSGCVGSAPVQWDNLHESWDCSELGNSTMFVQHRLSLILLPY